MLAYRQHLTIKNPQHLVLSNLPLKVGQQVEVLILVKEDTVEKTVNSSNQHQQTLTAREESISVPSDTLCEDKTINTSMTTAKPVINPAQAYTDAEWDKLAPDLRCELETQYILNNPILMKQIHDQSEWFPVSLEQLGINLKD